MTADLEQKVLGEWLETSRREARFLGSLDVLHAFVRSYMDGDSEPAELRNRFLSLARGLPSIKEIFLISEPEGRIVISTKEADEVVYMNRSELYTEGLRGFYTRTIYPWPLNREPTISFSMPFPPGALDPEAVLAMNLNLSRLDQVIGVGKRLGATAKVYLVDRYNALISTYEYGQRIFPSGIRSYGIEEALAGRMGHARYLGASGAYVLGHYRWLAELDMALIVEIEESEALGPSAFLGQALLFLGLLLMVLTGILGWRVAVGLSRPLELLIGASVKVAGGDLEASLPISGNDEIGRLGEAFRFMTARLKESIGQIRGERAFSDRLIESLPGIFYLYDAELRLRRWNRNLEETLGWGPRELEGRYLGDLLAVKDEAGLVAEAAGQVLEGGGTMRTMEASLLHRDGRHVSFLITGVRVEGPTGPMVAGLGLDLTARRQLEEQLRQSQKMESVGRLAGGIAHDFNNILTAIIGNLELCALSLGENSREREFVDAAHQAAESASSLTRQLLAFSRKGIVTPRTVDLGRILMDMRKMLSRLLGEDIRLSIDLSPDLWSVAIDPGQLNQIILNLCVNSRDAMPGGGLLSLSLANMEGKAGLLSAYPEAAGRQWLALRVSDSGTGMGPEVMEHLFEPFFTTKEMGRGTGLGLATVFGAVKQNGGFIHVESAPGKGTSFTIFLPRAAFPGEGPGQAKVQDRLGAGAEGGGETVLVVEDDEAIRSLAVRSLRRLGYAVVQASDGAQALELARGAGRLDLLLTDLIMPGMNGRELATILAGERPGLKVLFVSGYAADIIGRHGMLEADVDFLPKPYGLDELSRRVRACLDAGAADEPGRQD